MSNLSADTALIDPDDDRLGYAPLARRISEAILHLNPAEGLVVALNGPWGTGKSTVLNFTEFYLRELPVDEQPVVIRFNPWWFSGQDGLAHRFLDQFRAVLNKNGYDVAKLMENMKHFADLISDLPFKDVWIARVYSWLYSLIPRDVPAIKRNIEKILVQTGKKYLVIMDDIDRLTADEIVEVFRVVKAVADFPNVVYLLAFDNDTTADALSKKLQMDGHSYLEKIVLVPIVMPTPEANSLENLLFSGLDELIRFAPPLSFDETYWGNVFTFGISPMV